MIIFQLYLAFLCFLSDAIRLDTECQLLVNEFDGVVSPSDEICLIFVPRGKNVHINVTTNRYLIADGVFCESESTKDVQYDVEYVDMEFDLSYLATNETCPLDTIGVMKMVFRSRSAFRETRLSVKVTENYENEKSNGLTKKTGKQDKDEMKTTTAMIPKHNISDNTTEVWEQNNKEMNTTIAMLSEANTSKLTTELTILIVTVCGVVFILLIVFVCVYKFVDYKFKKRLLVRELQLEEIRHNQISQGTELSVLNENDPDHSDHPAKCNIELGSHSS